MSSSSSPRFRGQKTKQAALPHHRVSVRDQLGSPTRVEGRHMTRSRKSNPITVSQSSRYRTQRLRNHSLSSPPAFVVSPSRLDSWSTLVSSSAMRCSCSSRHVSCSRSMLSSASRRDSGGSTGRSRQRARGRTRTAGRIAAGRDAAVPGETPPSALRWLSQRIPVCRISFAPSLSASCPSRGPRIKQGIRGGCDRLTVSCDTRPDAFRSRRRRRRRRRFHADLRGARAASSCRQYANVVW